MKRSAHVTAPLLAAAALAVTTGCHDRPEMQRCVDEQNRVVAQSFCQNLPPVTGTNPGTFGYFPRYRYYYGGLGGWNTGSIVSGGGYTPMTSHAYTTSSAAPHAESSGGHLTSGSTSRGGFGSTHGGGGEAGGGGE